MKKRVILVVSSLAGVLIGLMVYQQVTQSERVMVNDEPPPPVGVGEGSPHFIQRDEEGNITREFGFERRIIDPEDQTVNVEPFDIEQLDIEGEDIRVAKPWVRLYERDDRVIEITAQTGTVKLEGSLAEGELPKSGNLEEVEVKICWRGARVGENAGGDENRAGGMVEMIARLSGRVDFELEFSRLDCAGAVSVASESFMVEGGDLTLEYDQINNRLRELQIRRINKLLMAGSEVAGQSSWPGPSESQEQQTTADTVEEPQPTKITTYQFSLSDQVVVTQPGGREIFAEEIILLADVDYRRLGRESSPKDKIGPESKLASEAAAEYDAAPQPYKPAEFDPNQAISITCRGPLLITIAEDAGLSPIGNRLEMTAYGQPAQVWREGRVVARADQIRFDQTQKNIKLSAGADRLIKLEGAEKQWITAEQTVQIDQDAGRAIFTGPGELEFAVDKLEEPGHFAYQDKLYFEFSTDPNADDFNLESLRPDRLEFVGGVRARYEDNLLIADKLSSDFLLDPNGNYVPAHVVAEGEKGKVRLTNENDGYQVIGDRLEGDARENIWRFFGNPARVAATDQQGQIEGRTIIADLNKQQFEVATPSTIQAQLQGNPFDQSSQAPVEVNVFCRDRVTYDHPTGQIVLHDPNALIEQTDKTRQITQILSNKIILQLADESEKTHDEPESSTGLDLTTLTAQGPEVVVFRREYDTATGELLSLLRLLSTEMQFDNTIFQMTALGPGRIDSYDYQAAPPQETPLKKQSLNSSLPGILGGRGPRQTIIRFGRQMLFDKPQNKLTFDGGVEVDYSSLSDTPKADRQPADPIAEMQNLQCLELILTFTENDQSADPNAPVINELERVTATGSVVTAATFSDGQSHFLAGENLVYDLPTDTIRMTGTGEHPVYLDGVRCSLVEWNVKDGAFVVKNIGRDPTK